MRKEKFDFWNIPVPKSLDETVEEAIRRDWHTTKSGFIRELVRRELEKLGIKPSVKNKEPPELIKEASE